MSKQLSTTAYTTILRTVFDKRATVAQKIAASCSRYLGTISDFVRGTDPAEYDRINNAIKYAYDVKWVEPTSEEPIRCLEHWADMFDILDELDNNVAIAVEILTNSEYLRKSIQQTSTATVNVYQERSQILALYDKYRADTCESVVAKIDKIGISADIIRQFAISRSKFNRITAHIMRDAIAETTDSKVVWELQSRVENLKNDILGSTREPLPMIVSRYGLVPITRVMSTSHMCEFLGIVKTTPDDNSSADMSDTDFDTMVEHAVANTPHGALVIYLGLYNSTQLEYNLSGLIDAEYVISHELKTNSGTGLTKKVIERMATINRLPRDIPTQPSISVHGRGRSSYWVIQRIIGGEESLYRMLGFGYFVDTPSVVYAPMITGLLNGRTTRPADYNEIHTDVILSTVYDSEIKTILSSYTVSKLQSPSSDLIRSKIMDKMTDNFLTSHASRQLTAKTIRTRAVDREFIGELLIEILMPNPTKNYTERIITAVAKIDTVSNVFINELEKRWMSAAIPDRIFREYRGDNLVEQLRGIFTNTTGSAIDELERTGTWASLEPTLKEFYFEYKSDRS